MDSYEGATDSYKEIEGATATTGTDHTNWSVPSSGAEALIGDLCYAVRKLEEEVDHCSQRIKQIDEIIQNMGKDDELKKFVPAVEKEVSCLVKRFDNLVNDHETLLSSHRSSTIAIVELKADLDTLKHQLAEIQKEVYSNTLTEQSMAIEEDDNKQPNQVKTGRKKWPWGEISTVKEMIERLREKIKSIETVVARLTQPEPPTHKCSTVNSFVSGMRKVIRSQLEKEEQRVAQRGERKRSSSKNKRDSGFQDVLVSHSTPHPLSQEPILQHQMSNTSSILESPMASVTSPVAINSRHNYPNTVPEDDASAQLSSSESPICTSRDNSFPHTPSSVADSSYASLNRDVMDSGELGLVAFLKSLLEFIDDFESNIA